ncbi:MAG: tRNA (adenosine(37)-N6)-threonylcarbamoyltransferase complex ATPase subunit type 1 TsaE [Phycisphaerae bacterium]|nr:tRNA (adenosine(37)-N6)-threonylcarbamoyltransferase complex ATPase subunit type 1 TsaE [Phycisphaerae bacterium]
MTDAADNTIEYVSNSPEETIQFGRRIGAGLAGGEIIGLTGPLGSGKTHLIKGIAAGAGAAECARVSSPTFVIVNEYLAPGARLDVYHIDAYRIETTAEFEMLGFDEICYRRSVVLIEWADKVADALAHTGAIAIELSHLGASQRSIVLRNPPRYLAEALK